jgi:hypothetical protein
MSTETNLPNETSSLASEVADEEVCNIVGANDMLGATRLAFYTPIRHYPPFADCKATAILAADGLMISVLILFNSSLIELLKGEPNLFWGMLAFLLVSFTVFLLIGVGCAYIALTLPIPPMPESLAFFPEIARLDYEEYRGRVIGLTHRQVVHKVLIYNHSLATLCTRKFGLVRRATTCLRVQFFLWIVLDLVVAFTSGYAKHAATKAVDVPIKSEFHESRKTASRSPLEKTIIISRASSPIALA